MQPSIAADPRPTTKRKPLWRRLHVRIAGWFLGLLVTVQLVSTLALQRTIESRADAQIAGDLRTSEAVLQRLLT